MSEVILTTLNARYIHSSLGLRCLFANMGELQPHTRILEFTTDMRPADVVEQLLAHGPRLVGFGVYIWNVEQTRQVAALLKAVRPETVVVLGGPEVSYETDEQPITALADHVITGPADNAFAQLCRAVLHDAGAPQRVIAPPNPDLSQLAFPYPFYTDDDIRNRLIYVEASRGCPYKCEFCLSSLDKTAWAFPLDAFLEHMGILYERGARSFKFVDRTFNLKIDHSIRILEFFLARLDGDLFLHFEVIPDHLPDRLKDVLTRFPPGSLQLEVGIQSFNPEVQALISRRQNNARSEENLRWLRSCTQAHIHADLIAGLPGEDLASFGAGFDRLLALAPHEIQMGILKRLRGTPIARHRESFGMVFNPLPPYNVLRTDRIGFPDMQRINRFARYWDMIANSGRFRHTLPLLTGATPFRRFLALTDWLYETTGQTHRIALPRLFRLLYKALTEVLGTGDEESRQALWQDYGCSGLKGAPPFAPPGQGMAPEPPPRQAPEATAGGRANSRQLRHLR